MTIALAGKTECTNAVVAKVVLLVVTACVVAVADDNDTEFAVRLLIVTLLTAPPLIKTLLDVKFVPTKVRKLPSVLVVVPLDIDKLATLKLVKVPFVDVRFVRPAILPPVICTFPELKLVATAVVAVDPVAVNAVVPILANPVALPPVICTFPELKLVAANVVEDKFVIPVTVPPVIWALPVLKFVPSKVVNDPSLAPVILPPVS
jgi:hypothetical protein